MHRFDDCSILADGRTRVHAEAASQTRHLVGQNVAGEIGRDDHVEADRSDGLGGGAGGQVLVGWPAAAHEDRQQHEDDSDRPAAPARSDG